MSTRITLPAKARYSFGGDEHIFVELSEEMSLEAFFKGISMCAELQRRQMPGVAEICPANSAILVKYDPDVIAPDAMLETLKNIEANLGGDSMELDTRIIEIPVYYNDPWTNETQLRFRDRHQDPSSTDLQYAARINGYESVETFIQAHAGSPWFVSMIGFVAGLPWLYQMVERDRQIEAPKYVRPRTDTPKHTIGYGGCFSCLYAVRGAGGYQMFGITPTPIYDPKQALPYFKENRVFLKPGDIVKWKSIDRAEYDRISGEVDAGTYEGPKVRQVTFSLKDFLPNPQAYNTQLLELLYGN
ncbi:allophanate hydrolase subunit 1 [Bordetella sp. FB-8]|uniref:5-oxoprolinase subunit B family protein n=1 Tax=Bordetella sp. FB-8 TaxID=1159870 RepID=UPI00037DF5DA|nr:allophanate hydrolase subunit 1 [Bordetella sp. FB-8]